MSAADAIRVLVVEDSAAEAALVCDELAFARSPGFSTRAVGRLAEALDVLAHERVDVVLLDLGLPDAERLAGVRGIRAAAPGVAIVVRSGLGDERIALEALELGAQDYIVKGPSGRDDRIERSIRYAMARRQADDSQRRLASIVDSSGDAIVGIDLDGTISSWNPGAERLYGYTAGEMVGQQAAILVPPELAGEEQGILTRAFAGELIDSYETQRWCRDGTIVEVSLTVSPITDSSGIVIGASKIARDITERRRADERFRMLLESAPDAMVIVDRAGAIMLVNAQTEALLGYARDELIGRPVEVLIPERYGSAHRDHIRFFLASPAVRPMGYGLELFARRKDGHEVPVEISLSPVDTGGAVLVAAALRDVTERRLAQAQLAQAEELFRKTIDYAPIGIALVSPGGRWLRVNRALCDMTGYAEGELLGNTFQEITHPDDLDADLDQVRRVISGEIQAYSMEKRYYRADGSILWILLSVSLVRDNAGEPVHFVAQIQDITERKRYEGELRHMAEHDALTGLPNRVALGVEITRQLTHQARYGGQLGLLMVDLDHFKYINDTLGHRVGDQVIRAVAGALRARLRASDLVARLGGDEFAVLLPETTRDAAARVASELIENLAELMIATADREVRVSASIGVAVVGGDHEIDEDGLLASADLAMYEAKEAGRARFAIHNSSNGNQLRATAKLNWSHRIRSALEHDRFVLHYQPVITLADRSLGFYEALIRMVGDAGEPVEPGTFLYIAERYGLMPAIDRWVVEHVVTTLASDQLPAGTRIALNASPRSLSDPGLLDLLERLIADHHVNPRQLIFEVTETAVISRLDEAKRFGRRLQRIGCGFALDDFGTGFGSFYHLKHLPYDYIKIDGDFVRDMASNKSDRLLVEALVGVARGMGKKTVAEYVGDEETLLLLRELGVDYGQGFYLGCPTPIEQLPRATGRDSAAARSLHAGSPSVVEEPAQPVSPRQGEVMP